MGMVNQVYTKKIYNCPGCGEPLAYFNRKPVYWQSKIGHVNSEGYAEGKSMELINGGLRFIAQGQPEGEWKWDCYTGCHRCKKIVVADMEIENGVFKKLSNLRLYD